MNEIANELCVAQVRSDYIEIYSLRGEQRVQSIPGIRDSAPLFHGRLAWDGSFVAGSSERGFVGFGLDGRQLWRDEEVSLAGDLAISANLQKIAFSGRDGRVVIVDVSTGMLRRLREHGKNPAWSVQSDRLAFDNGESVRVFELSTDTVFEVGRGTEPSWAPDGSVAVRASEERIDLVNLQTQERHPLIEASQFISVPRWSPDGEWMMYTRREPLYWWSKTAWTGSEPSQIIVRHIKSGAEASIGEFYKANPGDYTWISSRDLCGGSDLP